MGSRVDTLGDNQKKSEILPNYERFQVLHRTISITHNKYWEFCQYKLISFELDVILFSSFKVNGIIEILVLIAYVQNRIHTEIQKHNSMTFP